MLQTTSPMLSVCPVAGCNTLTLGRGPCLAHDLEPRPTFVRGKPYLTVTVAPSETVAEPVALAAAVG